MAENNPKLKILSTDARGKVFELNKDNVLCGRADSNDLVIKDPSVSSKHCSFIKNELGYAIKDENSTNGIFVNNIKVKTRPLKDEDIISIGSVELLYDSGYIKKTEQSKNKATINIGENHSNLPLADMQNFSPFANKKNAKYFLMKKLMIFGCIGLVVAAVALLFWIIFTSM